MMQWANISSIYFLGIGGIGMSALARYFNELGKEIFGYDKTATSLTALLEEEGMKIHYDDDVTSIPGHIDLFIYTPAIPENLGEFQYALQSDQPLMKRAEVIGQLSKNCFTVAVAGTHGKSTVTAITSHLFHAVDDPITSLIGAIDKKWNSNYIKGTENTMLVEADEYDRSLLHLFPNIAIITSTDADHLDVYGTDNAIRDTYQQFVQQIQTGGTLVYQYDLDILEDRSDITYKTYALNNDDADYWASEIEALESGYSFTIHTDKLSMTANINVWGLHNIENALAAFTCVSEVKQSNINTEGLANYKGIKRRFEIIFKSDQCVFIDDYAHHPTEIETLLSSVKDLFPEQKITVIFQPHLFSRTKDFAAGFTTSLSVADEVFLLPIYPARELPMEGVTSEILLPKDNRGKFTITDKEEILEIIKNDNIKVLLTVGAGDIDRLVDKLTGILKYKYETSI